VKEAGDTFYRETEPPANSEVNQPGDGVDYRADTPSTYVNQPRSEQGMPPGNPGFSRMPERDSMNPSSGKVIPDQMKQELRDQLTYPKAARVAAKWCNTMQVSSAWIDPQGKVHELGAGQTHNQWGDKFLDGDADYEESTHPAWRYLTDRGWVRLVNFLNLEVGPQGGAPRAMAKTVDLIVDCILSRRDIDPDDTITFSTGKGTKRPTVGDFVAEWGSPKAEERLYEGLMARVGGLTRRAKVAATLGTILGNTGPTVIQRASAVPLKPRRFNPRMGFWIFLATGSEGETYTVRIKGVRKGNVAQLSKAEIKCSCTCEFWRWQGPEHWAKTNDYLYRKPVGTASLPVIRDPQSKHWCCKHIAAALKKAQGYRFASAMGWSLEGVPTLEPSPERVVMASMETPAESAAISLLQGAPDEDIEDLIRDVARARSLFDPISRQQVNAEDVIQVLREMIPKPYSVAGGVKTYHATDPKTAELLLRRGFISATKPRSRVEEYAPGRGLDQGLYVGHSPQSVEGYGRVILEVTVPKKVLAVPMESAQLGVTDPLQSLREHDGAVILGGVPPEAFRVVEGERYLRG